MKLRRSRTNWYLGGVCGGIGEATGTRPILWRLIFIFTPSFWVYIILWIALFKEE